MEGTASLFKFICKVPLKHKSNSKYFTQGITIFK